MKTVIPLLVFAATLSGAATPVPLPATSRETCIDVGRVTTRRVLEPRTIEFTLTGGRVYRNRLTNECPHLAEIDRTYTLQFDDRNGRRVCPGDRFRVIDLQVARTGGAASYPFCRFGAFEPVARQR